MPTCMHTSMHAARTNIEYYCASLPEAMCACICSPSPSLCRTLPNIDTPRYPEGKVSREQTKPRELTTLANSSKA